MRVNNDIFRRRKKRFMKWSLFKTMIIKIDIFNLMYQLNTVATQLCIYILSIFPCLIIAILNFSYLFLFKYQFSTHPAQGKSLIEVQLHFVCHFLDTIVSIPNERRMTTMLLFKFSTQKFDGVIGLEGFEKIFSIGRHLRLHGRNFEDFRR